MGLQLGRGMVSQLDSDLDRHLGFLTDAMSGNPSALMLENWMELPMDRRLELQLALVMVDTLAVGMVFLKANL